MSRIDHPEPAATPTAPKAPQQKRITATSERERMPLEPVPRPRVERLGQVCPRCHTTMALTGVCDTCG